ncbi:TPA: glycosyltransferase family 2 protein, partial [Shigella flexneri]|nr:glycosyltransferase family 2 protein [Shigella flexneri]
IEFKKFIINNKNAAQDICLHDWFLYSFARTRNYSWYIDRKPTMLYRQHENNQVGANISFKAKYKRLGLVRNKWYRKEVTKIANALADDSFVNNQLGKGYIGNLILALSFWKLRRKKADK